MDAFNLTVATNRTAFSKITSNFNVLKDRTYDYIRSLNDISNVATSKLRIIHDNMSYLLKVIESLDKNVETLGSWNVINIFGIPVIERPYDFVRQIFATTRDIKNTIHATYNSVASLRDFVTSLRNSMQFSANKFSGIFSAFKDIAESFGDYSDTFNKIQLKKKIE